MTQLIISVFSIPDPPPCVDALRGENKYLAHSVGFALRQGLAEVVVTRPQDPIEFLAHWLYRHAKDVEHIKQVSMSLAISRLYNSAEVCFVVIFKTIVK